MKYRAEFDREVVHEWKDYYIDYDSLEKQLGKASKELYGRIREV